MNITQEQYDSHDCHSSPEDGCEVCEEWQVQQQVANDIKFDAHKERVGETLDALNAIEMQLKLIEKALLKAQSEGKKKVNLKGL